MQVEEETGLQIEDALSQPTIDGRAQMVLSNSSGFTQVVEQGLELGIAILATVIQPTWVPMRTYRACQVIWLPPNQVTRIH